MDLTLKRLRIYSAFSLPGAFIFALKQRRSRKFKAAFDPSPAFS
jgi:hypothetical protein